MRFSLLTNRSAASVDDNDLQHKNRHAGMRRIAKCFILVSLDAINKIADFFIMLELLFTAARSPVSKLEPKHKTNKNLFFSLSV